MRERLLENRKTGRNGVDASDAIMTAMDNHERMIGLHSRVLEPEVTVLMPLMLF